jgi:hypothetical protein
MGLQIVAGYRGFANDRSLLAAAFADQPLPSRTFVIIRR